MLCEGSFEISNGNLLILADRYKYDYASNFSSDILIREILERSGLLVENEYGLLEFKHRTFLDYFGGMELNSQRDAAKVLVERFGDSNWSRAVFFACGLRPDSDEYLEGIINKVPDDDIDQVFLAFNMGFVAQAAVHVRRKTKYELAKQALVTFANGWNSFASDFVAHENIEAEKSFLPSPYVTLIYSSIVRTSLGSTTLVPALDQIADAVLTNAQDFSGLPDNERQRFELFVFSLAVACSSSGSARSFTRVLASNVIQNPVYALIGELEVNRLLKGDFVEDSVRTDLLIVGKKLKRKISNNNTFLKNAFNSPPTLILGEDEAPLGKNWEFILGSGPPRTDP